MRSVISIEDLKKEISFRTSRSSGSGGQNVNKVETRVEALLDVNNCTSLTELQRTKVKHRLKNRINANGILAISCSETRSQKRNRKIASERLADLISVALTKKKIRKKTGIPAGITRKRLKKKKEQSEKKSRRGFRPDSLL